MHAYTHTHKHHKYERLSDIGIILPKLKLVFKKITNIERSCPDFEVILHIIFFKRYFKKF